MITVFERMLSFRYLRARRKEGFISVIAAFSFIGIALGVATLIVVMSVMNGFRYELMERILGINAHISVVSHGAPIENDQDFIRQLTNIDGIKNASAQVQGQVLATANDEHTGVQVRGMYHEDLQQKILVSENIKSGNIDNFTGTNTVLIGSRLAYRLRVDVGDWIRLISPKTTSTFIGSIPRMKDYKVVGTFEVGMFEYDSSTVFMPIDAARLYFQVPDNSATYVEIMIDNPEHSDAVSERIMMQMDRPYRVLDWKQANSHFIKSLKVERNVMFLILTLIIIVAAFNIISGMVMLVNDKGKEIAILRTIGATRGSILRVFITTGSLIGLAGTACGVALGLSFALNIEAIRQWLEGLTNTKLFAEEVYFLSQLPARVESADVILVVSISVGLSFLATLYPAWRAASIDPADGLRYE